MIDEHLEMVYQRLAEFYASGDVPWDDVLPPPEVIQKIEGLAPGRALDLGSGYGRASIFMAKAGWEVDGVDFVPRAAAEAADRASEAGVNVRFHIGSVTDLGFLAGGYDFVLDVGCMHALDEKGLALYRSHLERLLKPDGRYLLFVRLRDETDPLPEEGPKGILEAQVVSTFSKGFELEKVERGVTDMEERGSWRSAWFHYRRTLEDNGAVL